MNSATAGPQDAQQRYWAFISYSWTDKRAVRSLHRRLERFSIPHSTRKLLAYQQRPASARLRPIFRDDDEMAVSGSLDDRLRGAIDASDSMVLFASPEAAKSQYVNDEVHHFVTTRGTEHLIIIATGSDPGRDPVLPPALYQIGRQLLWVDCRGGRRLGRRAFVRVVAAILRVDFDQLWQRQRRRRRQLVSVAAVAAAALVTAFGGLVWQQRTTELRAQHNEQLAQQNEQLAQHNEQLTPERQRSEFETFITQDILADMRKFTPDATAEDVQVKVLRNDDLNGDGLLDYFVSNVSPGFCGSGGCTIDVYLTESVGQYAKALGVLGATTPQVRDRPGGTKEIIATDYHINREPLYSIYRLEGNAYRPVQYEFCDGMIIELCQPTVITPIPESDKLHVGDGAIVRQRPTDDAGPADSGVYPDAVDMSVIGVLPDRDWYLVNIWKGMAGFVPARSIVG